MTEQEIEELKQKLSEHNAGKDEEVDPYLLVALRALLAREKDRDIIFAYPVEPHETQIGVTASYVAEGDFWNLMNRLRDSKNRVDTLRARGKLP